MYLTFSGKRLRVQLSVYEPPKESTDTENRYTVTALPIKAAPNTPFSKGSQRYHGGSFNEAWHLTQRLVGDNNMQVPNKFLRFVEGGVS